LITAGPPNGANPVAPPADLQIGDLRVVAGTASVSRDGEPLALPKLSFDLLVALARAAPNLMTIDELMDRVWPGSVVEAETVSQRVKLLRQALGDDPREPRYIAGVRGRGYRIIAPVSVPTPAPAPGTQSPRLPASAAAAAPSPPAGSPAVIRPQPRSRLGLGMVVAASVLTAAVWWGFRERPAQPSRSLPAIAINPVVPAAGQGGAGDASPRTTVAVLPFVNLTGDASKEYLGDGMAEQLIDTLSKVPGLKVPARTSTFAYKGRNTDIRQIAKDLGVGSIVEGSVRAAGKRIRITAQLINAEDGLHLWSGSYDEEFTDLFKLQDHLATQIATALQSNLGEAAQTAAAQARPTNDVEAYNLSLQAWSLVGRVNEQNEKQALIYFQQAVGRDPRLASAYAGIARAQMTLAVYGQSTEHVALAERAAHQALALDPTLARVHTLLADIAQSRGRLLEMEAHSAQALALGANDSSIHGHRAYQLVQTGRLRATLEEAQKAYAMAPADLGAISTAAFVNSVAGRDVESRRLAELAVTLGARKDDGPLGWIGFFDALRSKHYAEAGQFPSRRYADASPGSEEARAAEVIHLVSAALADPRERPAALAAHARLYPALIDSNRPMMSNAAPCLQSSWSYAILGAMDVAYELANQCLDRIVPGQTMTAGVLTLGQLWTPELHVFRQDKRFQALAGRLGLMEYWQQYGPPDLCDLKDGMLTCH
jgi:TolB-like protein/DNA-binding winged helix-turn-helix (wHTH) protein